jgi:hypothetical protein
MLVLAVAGYQPNPGHHHSYVAGLIFLAFVCAGVAYVVLDGKRKHRALHPRVDPLAAAVAVDHQWDRAVLDDAVRAAWARRREGSVPISHIVLRRVIDQRATGGDRAEFAVIAGGGAALLVLQRTDSRWTDVPLAVGAPQAVEPAAG